jgi:hypothetical protein
MTENKVLFPHGVLNAKEVITDYLDDNQRRLKRDLAGVNEACNHWKPDPGANSIAVTLWHMGRILDVFLTLKVKGQTPESECWFSGGWSRQTGYDPRGIGRDGWGSVNGYTVEEVDAIPLFIKEQLLGYIDEVYESVRQYVRDTPIPALSEAAPGFEGQYTKYQVLSMAILDNVRHLGEICTLKSMWERTRAEPGP